LNLSGVVLANISDIEIPSVANNGSVTVAIDATPPVITNVMLTTSNPIDTDPDFGWENFSCTVTDNVAVDEVKLVITGDTTAEYPMTKNGDNYYINTTISTADEYTYHIWADDIIDNEITSPVQYFDLPTNWDIDMNGCVHFMDLVAVSGMYGQTGPGYPTGGHGWVRADVDNNGHVHFMDLMKVVGQYHMCW